MSKEELEPKLAELMSEIPEIEGIVAFKTEDGSLISGQTIEEKDINGIASKSFNVIPLLKELSIILEKGDIKEMTLSMADGYLVLSIGKTYSIIAFVGLDGKNQVALVARALKNLLA
ncbi:MAG: hypothetical protein ACTSU2_15255 [Promethearchaeota archaeon]